MKIKKIISVLSATAIFAVCISVIPVGAEDKDFVVSESLSGYVTGKPTKGSIALVADGVAKNIYVDSADYEGVIRAAEDLKGDIADVTGYSPKIVNTTDVEAKIVSVNTNDIGNIISVKTANMDSAETCVMTAVYNPDATLKSVTISDSNSNGIYTFASDITYSTEKGETYKVFAWEKTDSVSMKPITDIYDGTNQKTDSAVLIIGTIGKSAVVDSFIANGELDVSDIQGKWECFKTAKVGNSIVIAGSDKRGTIYGIYDLSEKMGVSPWKWWADVTPTHSDELYIDLVDGAYTEGEPSVKYRGIFINDEANLNAWSKSLGDGDMNEEMYEKVFELLLRLKSNLLWPGMHPYTTAFNNYENNAKNADRYGIVMGSSHCEMLLRNNLGEIKEFQTEWMTENSDKPLYTSHNNEINYDHAYIFTDINPDTGEKVYNKEFLEDYWRAGVRERKNYESIYTIGMRGMHDGEFMTPGITDTAGKIELMEEIISLQRKILTDELGKPAEEIPQLFIPYKGVLELYNNGLEVPDDVTLMWPDDNFGYIRQNAGEKERARSGGNGIYYHLSYYGTPKSYLWLASTQPGLIRQEMTKAYDMGSQTMWIANVGDIKPGETIIEYFLDLARNVDIMHKTDLTEYFTANAKRDFGFSDEEAEEYADIHNKFYHIVNTKRPDHMRREVFSVTNYGDEGQKYIDTYKVLKERSEALYSKLPEDKKAAFYELQLYPLRSAYNIALDYISADKADLYAKQGRGSAANKYASIANQAAADIDTDTAEYNSMLNGKWNKIMSLHAEVPRYSGIQRTVTTKLTPSTVSELDFADMGIAVENQSDLTTAPELAFSSVSKLYRFIDIYNTGYGSFEWSAESKNGYVIFNENNGTVYDEHRIYAAINWDKIVSDIAEDTITISMSIGGNIIKTLDIAVDIRNPYIEIKDNAYIEADGYVSIEAEHYSDSVKNGEYEWRVEKNYGKNGDSLKIYPNSDSRVETPNIFNSAYTEYEVYFEKAGTYPIDIYRMPTLNETGTQKFAIGVGDDTPTTLTGNNTTGNSTWERNSYTNTNVVASKVTVKAGYNTIRLYNIDSGVVIDKMVITTNGKRLDSYFAAPESYNKTYNGEIPVLPEASEPSIHTKTVTKLFEPELITISADYDEGTVSGVTIAKLDDYSDSAIVAAVLYNENGFVTGIDYADVDFSSIDVNGTVTADVSLAVSSADAQLSVIIFNNYEELKALSTQYSINLNNKEITAEPACDTMDLETDISQYVGNQAIILVSKSGEDVALSDNTVYIKQEKITKETFDIIPFDETAGRFDVKISVPNKEIFTENINTVINITPDENESQTQLHNWTFDTDADIGANGDNDIPVLYDGASYDSENQMIKMNGSSGGSAKIIFSKPIPAKQGNKLIVKFDVYYGKLTKKFMSYTIKDSNGKSFVYSNICAYGGQTQTLNICESNRLKNPSSIPPFITSANNGINAGAVTYTHVIDFENDRVTVTAESSAGTETYTGRITEEFAENIATINFFSSYNNGERICYVDNVSVITQSGPKYAIDINAENANGEAIENAEVIVDDNGDMIEPNDEGKFMLCEGTYNVTISADGYYSLTDTITVSQSMESKKLSFVLESGE